MRKQGTWTWSRSQKGGIRLEALVELRFFKSSFSSSNFSIRAFRACPLAEATQAVPCRAIRGTSSDSRQQHHNQQYPPPLYILQRGVQWKQGVVIYMTLCTSLLCNTTPILCTPDPLHPPLQSIHPLSRSTCSCMLIGLTQSGSCFQGMNSPQ